jgi:predicted ABC-type ATPase
LDAPIIDPDAEARKINPSSPESVVVAAGKQAIRLARDYLKNNQSFAVETTLSGNTYIKMMQQAKQQGYELNFIFVGINHVDTAIRRVAERVRSGGHNVPEEDIRRRYNRGLANLPIALQLVDNAIIFDNSTSLGHQIKLTIENRKVTQQSESLPEWFIGSVTPENLQSLLK